MPKQFDQRSLKLTAQQWAVLESLAAQTNSAPPTGTNAGQPSWRTLIKRIADGEIVVTLPPSDNAG